MMLAINDPAVDRSAVGVHVENRKKNSDPTHCRVQNFGFFHFDNVGNGSIGRGHHRLRIRRRGAVPGRGKMPECQESGRQKTSDNQSASHQLAIIKITRISRIQRASDKVWSAHFRRIISGVEPGRLSVAGKQKKLAEPGNYKPPYGGISGAAPSPIP